MGKRKSLLSGVFFSLELTSIVCFTFFVAACHTGTSISKKDISAAQEANQRDNLYTNAEIATRIIPSVNNTFGYNILLYGRPFVHQPNIPGLPGNEGFITRERAQAVADLVVKKIRNNEMPPTVTMEDLNTMGVLK
jgi:hypothetical protein